MVHVNLNDAKFWGFLLDLDADLAAAVQAGGCDCGGVLHRASYPRKPRGVSRSVHPARLGRRLSFCCGRDGCRKRRTPPSLVFLGRRLYLGAVVVLASALAQGFSLRRCEFLRRRFGVSVRTLARWRSWWREAFATSPVSVVFQ
jgi:hypothetical protein